MKVIPMAEEHIPAVAALEEQCFSSPWSRESLRGMLSHACYVAEADGVLTGYAGMQCIKGEGYIANIAVAPFSTHRFLSA